MCIKTVAKCESVCGEKTSHFSYCEPKDLYLYPKSYWRFFMVFLLDVFIHLVKKTSDYNRLKFDRLFTTYNIITTTATQDDIVHTNQNQHIHHI